MKVNTIKQLVGVATLAVILTACSQNPVRDTSADESASAEASNLPEGVVRYTVKPGDSISNIAEDFTGDIQNWQYIAQYNKVSDPRLLRDGTVLEIPMSLIPGFDPADPQATPSYANNALDRAEKRRQAARPPQQKVQSSAGSKAANTAAATTQSDGQSAAETAPGPEAATTAEPMNGAGTDTSKAPVSDADAASESVATSQSSEPVSVAQPGTEKAEVQLTALKTRPAEVTPVPAGSDAGDTAATAGQRSIRVIGTYYPKGIYAEPAASSALLMRVAPGTEFALDRSVENWYRVKTDSGTGYIRASDARLLP